MRRSFSAGLKDPHSFGVKPYSPSEQIDQETWLERIHDFKAHLWWLIRSFFRGQFTDEARDSIRERQAKLGKRSQVVGAAQFARVPLLNESQLVARWKLVVPPALVSETQQLPIDNANGGGLDAGVYLIEATDGTYKAYTVAIVTKIAVVERTVDGKAFLYVADRKTGAPVDQADVVLWGDGKLQSSGKTGSDGLASLTYTVRGGAQGAEPENVWILARHGADAALVTPLGYGFGAQNQQQERDYIYTDRPVYRPGHTVHIKAIVRKEMNDNLVLPDERTLTMRVTGPDDKVVFKRSCRFRRTERSRRTSILPPMRRWVITASISREASADGRGVRGRQRQFLRRGVQEARVPGDGESRRRRACSRATRFRRPLRRGTSLASRLREPR